MTPVEIFANADSASVAAPGASATLAADPGASGTTLTFTTGEGARFPTLATGQQFRVKCEDEIMIVTAHAAAADTATVTRGANNVAHAIGSPVTLVLTAESLAAVTDAKIASSLYGDGSLGDVTISTAVTLTEDAMYENLTITSSGILKPAGWRIFVRNACIIDSGGAIHTDGGNAAANAGGQNVANNNQASLGYGQNGANGTASGVGTNGTAPPGSNIGGSGGAGGASGTPNAGGAGGVVVPPTSVQSPTSYKAVPMAIIGAIAHQVNAGATTWRTLSGGGSGGSGGGDGNLNAAGGGGGSGGVLMLAARSIANSGRISANGGNGSPQGGGGPNGGGGGGGGGGLVIVVTNAFSGSTPQANGGTRGTPTSGTGSAGVNGSAGKVLLLANTVI